MKIPVLCLLLAVTPIACGEREDPGDGRPSIVLISLDTTRPDHLSVNGYEHETTPNLARLALDGQVFPNFVTASSWTLPTHASLFTGLHPTTHGARYSKRGDTALSDAVGRPGFFGFYRANRLPDAAVTLAEVLQAEGYQTFGVGSGPWLKPIFGLHQGFEEYDGDTSSLEGRRAEEANALALRDLERAGRRPFFLFVNYFDPHSPYDPHGDLAQRFRGRGEDQAQLDQLAAYDAEIFQMDRALGELLDALRASGVYDRCLIVVTSDHGEQFGEHGLVEHGFALYEEAVRGVLIIKPPKGLVLALDTSLWAQSVDIMPTILTVVGIESQPEMEGQPLGSITHPIVSELFPNLGNMRWMGHRFDRALTSVHEDGYKLIVSTQLSDRDAGLYKLSSDPGEATDLSAVEPERVQSMVASLRRWRAGLLPPLIPQAVDEIDAVTRRQMRALGYLEGEE